MAKFGNDIIKVTPVGGSEFDFEGIVDQNFQRNSQINQADVGHPYADQANIGFQPKVLSITSEDFFTITDEQLTALNGVCYATNVTPGLRTYQLRRDRCEVDGRESTALHMSMTSALGHLLLDTVTANAGANVQCRLSAHLLSGDGQTDPEVTVFNQAISTYTPPTRKFKLANPIIDGAYVDSCESATINYNHRFAKPISGEANWPTEFDWQQCGPVISLTFSDVEAALTAISDTHGDRLTSANSYLQFQASDLADGGWHNPADTAHIRCSFNGLAHVTTPMSASGSAASRATVEIITTENVTGLPLIWQTDSTLTTS